MAIKQQYRIQPGKVYWFEYHCNESDSSADAELWYRSHQQVTVLKRIERGGGKTEEERAYNGHPAAYKMKFSDGFVADGTEDEFLEDRKEFNRPDPPLPPSKRKDKGAAFLNWENWPVTSTVAESDGFDDEEELSNFQKDLPRMNVESLKSYLRNNFYFNDNLGMWVIICYSDFVGSNADRANGIYFVDNYPGLVTKYPSLMYKEVRIGVVKEEVRSFDGDSANRFYEDTQNLKEGKVLDDTIYKVVIIKRRREAWDEIVGKSYAILLMLKFANSISADSPLTYQLLQMGKNGLLSGLFEEARDLSGQEWHEHSGGRMGIDVEKIAEATTLDMLERWKAKLPQQENQDTASLEESAKFSWVGAPAPVDISNSVMKWGQMFIDNDDLYIDPKKADDFGREKDIHVTVKYGLHEARPSHDLLRLVEETQPFEIEIGPASIFDTNPIYDVVKFDVEGEALRTLNKRISQLPCTDSFPDYNPHMTVAYVVKNSCNDLIGKPLVETEAGAEPRFMVTAIVFSNASKNRTTLFLGKPNPVENTKPVEGKKVIESADDDDFKDIVSEPPGAPGEEIVRRLLEIGTALGGFSNYSLRTFQHYYFRLETLDVRDLLETDPDFAEYTKAFEERSYDYSVNGGLKSREADEEFVEPQNLYNEPIIIINQEIRDGYSRAADHLKQKDYPIKAWVAVHSVKEAQPEAPRSLNVDRLPASSFYSVIPASSTNPFVHRVFHGGKYFMSPDNRFVEVADHEPSAAAMLGEKAKSDDQWLDRYSAKLSDLKWVRILFSDGRVTYSWPPSRAQLKELMDICIENGFLLEDDTGRFPRDVYVPGGEPGI